MNAGNLQRETHPIDADPFSFIDVWSFNSMSCKDSESSHNRPFTHFDKAGAKFRWLTFDQSLEDSIFNPYYKR